MDTIPHRSARALDAFPVSVVVERQPVEGNRWTTERWLVIGVVAGEHVSGDAVTRTLVRSNEAGEQYLWRGFSVELFLDEAASYYFNLMGDKPSVFVVCTQAEESEELEPFLVTASYDEADSYMETDEPVFSVPMPPELYRWVERFVLEHYVPEQRKKRRRANWKDGEEDA